VHCVVMGLCAQDLHRGRELLACFGQVPPKAEGFPGGGLVPGRRTVLTALEVIIAGAACMLDGRGPVAIGNGCLRGALP
jgi:hypothetical protein